MLMLICIYWLNLGYLCLFLEQTMLQFDITKPAISSCIPLRGDKVRVFIRFSNILVVSWRSVLLVEETGVPGENHRPAQVTDKLIAYVAMNPGNNYQLP
jgi:hypothetical protein